MQAGVSAVTVSVIREDPSSVKVLQSLRSSMHWVNTEYKRHVAETQVKCSERNLLVITQ